MRYQKPIEHLDFCKMIFAPKFVSTHFRINPSQNQSKPESIQARINPSQNQSKPVLIKNEKSRTPEESGLGKVRRLPTLAQAIQALPSAMRCLTAEFGMGSGLGAPPKPPGRRNTDMKQNWF
jgi:hypothetical protein